MLGLTRVLTVCQCLIFGIALAACSTASRRAPARSATTRDGDAFATGRHGAVTSAESAASEVGRAALQRGGNAVDAAVAVGFALSVTHPSAGGIGGGGFMLVRLAGGPYAAIDYREVAPLAARRDMFIDAHGHVTRDSQWGPRAAGIPGVVAGLALAHRSYGTRPWVELVEPAVALARDGVVLDSVHAAELANARKEVADFAATLTPPANGESAALYAALQATLRTFSRRDGTAYAAGERFLQPELAETLQRIAHDGPDSFYRGPFAQDMADRVRAMGGVWTAEDLARYSALAREPIVFDYHGYEIATMPPPSAGGVVLRQFFAAADAMQLAVLPWDSAARIHLYVEILRRAYADRNQLIGDPAFVDIPLSTLLDPSYAAARARTIDLTHATPSRDVSSGVPYVEGKHTTHFSIVDRTGMAVSNTVTLNADFGALVQVPGTGVTLNDEMDDFAAQPGAANGFGLVQGEANAIAPGKRMLSSMSPTIISRAGQLRAVLGSPGGPTITTTVAQLALQLIDYKRSLFDAVNAPRVHHQWLPDVITHEPGLAPDTLRELTAFGHTLELEHDIGHAHCIEVDPQTGELRAVADVARGGGRAVAY